MTATFRFACSYQGCVWYKVFDETGQYEIELRRRADDYERKCYNGDDSDWQRNVVDMIGVLRRSHDLRIAISTSTFNAFNAWLLAEHAAHVAKLHGDPIRYGEPSTYVIGQPTLAHAAARYENGWIITDRADVSIAA